MNAKASPPHAPTSTPSTSLVLVSEQRGVTTLTMNMPRRYNGWTAAMLTALRSALRFAERDDSCGAVVLTGADPYYCAGVNLAGTITLDHPKALRAAIAEQNAALFNLFIDFSKPILIAFNGPAIGASVTSALLCDGRIASNRATFSLPFARLGVPPEGCSSVLFPKLFGERVTERMMGKEAWQPSAEEALEFGLVDEVVEHEQLLERAQAIASEWVASGKKRAYPANTSRQELHAINAKESSALAGAFLSARFLKGQYEFLLSRKKYAPAATFLLLFLTRPVWSLLL